MKRPMILLCVIMVALVVAGLFQVKHKVQSLKKDLLEINRQLASNHDEIHVLSAEWAYLNEPMRIKELADEYLNLQYSSVAQLKDNNDVRVAYLTGEKKRYASGSFVSPTLRPTLSSY